MSKYLSNKIKNISFVLTILVVILHAYNIENNISIVSFIQTFISYGIATIAVPIFFMISGYLFFYKFEPSLNNWIKKYKKRFKTLLVPFIIWCTGWMIVLYIIQLTPIGDNLFTHMVLSEFSFKEILKYTYVYPIPFQLWYISALIECVIISPIIYYLIKKIGQISGYILFICWILSIIKYPIALFSIGAYLAIRDINLELKLNTLTYRTILILFIILTGVKTYLSYFDVSYFNFLGNIVILLGVLSIWIGYDRHSDLWNKSFDVTKYGIFIYFFHEPLQSVIIRLMFKVLGTTQITHLIVYMLTPVITIFISICVGKFIDRYMNNSYAVLTGGR